MNTKAEVSLESQGRFRPRTVMEGKKAGRTIVAGSSSILDFLFRRNLLLRLLDGLGFKHRSEEGAGGLGLVHVGKERKASSAPPMDEDRAERGRSRLGVPGRGWVGRRGERSRSRWVWGRGYSASCGEKVRGEMSSAGLVRDMGQAVLTASAPPPNSSPLWPSFRSSFEKRSEVGSWDHTSSGGVVEVREVVERVRGRGSLSRRARCFQSLPPFLRCCPNTSASGSFWLTSSASLPMLSTYSGGWFVVVH